MHDTIYAGVLVGLICLYLYKNRRGFNVTNLIAKSSQLILWLTILVAIIMLYAFRFELNALNQRFLSVVVPSYTWTSGGEIKISRNHDGHFYINALIGKKKIRFLIDTGASDIAITKSDAQLLGIDVNSLKYTKKYATANGISYSAPVVLKELTLGKKIFRNVQAHVGSGENDTSLLGMSIINQFSNFTISRDVVILKY